MVKSRNKADNALILSCLPLCGKTKCILVGADYMLAIMKLAYESFDDAEGISYPEGLETPIQWNRSNTDSSGIESSSSDRLKPSWGYQLPIEILERESFQEWANLIRGNVGCMSHFNGLCLLESDLMCQDELVAEYKSDLADELMKRAKSQLKRTKKRKVSFAAGKGKKGAKKRKVVQEEEAQTAAVDEDKSEVTSSSSGSESD